MRRHIMFGSLLVSLGVAAALCPSSARAGDQAGMTEGVKAHRLDIPRVLARLDADPGATRPSNWRASQMARQLLAAVGRVVPRQELDAAVTLLPLVTSDRPFVIVRTDGAAAVGSIEDVTRDRDAVLFTINRTEGGAYFLSGARKVAPRRWIQFVLVVQHDGAVTGEIEGTVVHRGRSFKASLTLEHLDENVAESATARLDLLNAEGGAEAPRTTHRFTLTTPRGPWTLASDLFESADRVRQGFGDKGRVRWEHSVQDAPTRGLGDSLGLYWPKRISKPPLPGRRKNRTFTRTGGVGARVRGR
jgi:hypothetical protein